MALMKIMAALRYGSLFTLGLMAGGAFAFVVGLHSAIDRIAPLIAQAQTLDLPSFFKEAGFFYAFIAFALALDLYLNRKQWKSLEYLLVIFALLCLLDEGILTWTGYLPEDRWITVWDLVDPPHSWMNMSTQWLWLLYIRSALLMASFALLLASTLLASKNQSSHSDVVAVF